MSAKKKSGSSISAQCDSCGNFFLRLNSKNRPDSKPSTPNSAKSSTPNNTKTSTPSAKTATLSASSDTSICSHGDVWETGEEDAQTVVQFVVPRVGLCALPYTLEKRDSFLPSALFGWERRNAALFNSETISQLCILPRSAIIVDSPSAPSSGDFDLKTIQRGIFTVWPCNEVPQMRVNLPAEFSPSAKFIRAYAAKTRRISSLLLSLHNHEPSAIPEEFVRRLAKDDAHFNFYLKSYLSNAYLNRSVTVAVNFYTKKLFFSVKEVKFADESEEFALVQSIDALRLNDERRAVDAEVFMVTAETNVVVAWNLASAEDGDEDVRTRIPALEVWTETQEYHHDSQRILKTVYKESFKIQNLIINNNKKSNELIDIEKNSHHKYAAVKRHFYELVVGTE